MERSHRYIIRILAAATLIAVLAAGCGTPEGTAGDSGSRTGVSQTSNAGEEYVEAEEQETDAAEENEQVQDEGERDPNEPVSREIFAMDTYMSISAYGEEADTALDEAEEEILRLDALLAAEHDDSEIAILNQSGGGAVSEDTAYLVRRAVTLHEETDGAFDITVYPLKELWGFTTQEYRVPSEEEIQETLPVVGTDLIELQEAAENDDAPVLVYQKEGVRIDLGGIAKGYTSARVAEIFEKHGVHGMINLGGNVQLVGPKPDGSLWRVAIRKPESTEDGAIPWLNSDSPQAEAVGQEDFIGILETSGQAVVTSGGYERYFEAEGKIYHHILDASTGYPSDSDLISATVVSADGTLADGLSTSIFVMGLDRAAEYWKSHSGDFDMIVMNKNGELFATEGLRDRFTSGLPINWLTR